MSCLLSKTQARDRWFSHLVSHRLCEAGVAVPHFTDRKAEARYKVVAVVGRTSWEVSGLCAHGFSFSVITGQPTHVPSPGNSLAAPLFIECHRGSVWCLDPDLWSWAKLKVQIPVLLLTSDFFSQLPFPSYLTGCCLCPSPKVIVRVQGNKT